MNYLHVFFSFLAFVVCVNNMAYAGVKPKYVTRDYIEPSSTTAIVAAIRLDEIKKQIDYCLRNVGKNFDEVDLNKVGDNGKGLFSEIRVITYGLIAYKHFDLSKSAEYFYRDWLEYRKFVKGEKSLWHEGPGDYNPLGSAINQWKTAGMYKEALSHYREYYDDTFLLQPMKGTIAQKRKFLEKELRRNPMVQSKYKSFMEEWNNLKNMSGIQEIKHDADVENYVLFHSDEQNEVLKALLYYHGNKVEFMLKKALVHKNPVVAAKAKEYLEDLKKGENHETETRKP